MSNKSIKNRLQAMSNQADIRELRPLLNAVYTDLTEIRTELAATVTDVATLAAAVDTLAAKLNADAGVTDENYAETNAAAVTASAPDALTLTS